MATDSDPQFAQVETAITSHIEDAHELIELLRPSAKTWNRDDASWLFRGQNDTSWTLTPPSLRSPPNELLLRYYMPARVRLESASDDWMSLPVDQKNVLVHATAELLAVHAFARLADQAHHSLDWRDSGDSSFQVQFKELFPHARVSDLRLPFDVIAIAQHHGIPTRLLDFTRHPLIALYFACVDGKGHFPVFDQDRNACIWAVNFNYFAKKRRLRIHEVPRFRSPYIAAQHGVFLYNVASLARQHASHFVPYSRDMLELEWLEKGIPDPMPIRLISFPSRLAMKIVPVLACEGLTRAHIMPTLDNVAATIHVGKMPIH